MYFHIDVMLILSITGNAVFCSKRSIDATLRGQYHNIIHIHPHIRGALPIEMSKTTVFTSGNLGKYIFKYVVHGTRRSFSLYVNFQYTELI